MASIAYGTAIAMPKKILGIKIKCGIVTYMDAQGCILFLFQRKRRMLELQARHNDRAGKEKSPLQSVSPNLENHDLIEIFDGFIRYIIAAMTARDPATASHSIRVSEYTVELAKVIHASQLPAFKDIEFTPELFEEIRFASLLHDVGKVVIRRDILRKSAKLQDAEFAHLLERIDLFAAWFSTQTPETLGADYRSPENFRKYREVVRRVVKADVQPTDEENACLDEMTRTFISPCPNLPLLSQDEHECLHIPYGTLSESERTEIRRHARISYEYLTQIPWPPQWANVPNFVLQHHEKLDGSGYPHGLSGEQILFQSRMITVCDIFDALTGGDRSYKTRHNIKDAAQFLVDDVRRGKLDADIVDIFISEVIPKIRESVLPPV